MLLSLLWGCVDAPCAGFEGNTLYVYGAEEEHRQGTNPRAFESIREALTVAEAGTGICIGPGTWNESLNVTTPGISLLGAGSDLTFLEPVATGAREGDTTGIQVGAGGLDVRNLTIRDATRGVYVRPGHGLHMEGVVLVTNGTGLFANEPDQVVLEDVSFIRNTSIGALVTANGPVPPLTLRNGVFAGNGSLGSSEVGGLYSDRDVDLIGTRFSDNAGSLAADLYVEGHLGATRLTIDRPAVSGGAPRVIAGDGATLRHAHIVSTGATAVSVRCRDLGAEVENMALHSTGGEQPLLRFQDCTGSIVHATVVADHTQVAVELLGDGQFEVANSVFIGVVPVEGELAREGVNFVGSLGEAGLSSGLSPEPGSPLVDGGEELGVIADIDGRPRPSGAAPDLGAFELY